jgi:hypothetical protein
MVEPLRHVSEPRTPPATLPDNASGFIARGSGGSFGLERWALYRPDGTYAGSFAFDETREQVAASLLKMSAKLLDDDSVVPL